MKQLYALFIVCIFNTLMNAQGYEFGLEHNGGNSFSVVAKPNFTQSNTDISDIGFTLVLPAGSADVINLSSFYGRVWSATEATASQLTSLGLGDGSKDIFVMNLPTGQTVLSHTADTSFELVSFQISNIPSTGEVRFLDNSSSIALAFSGALDSFYNSDIDGPGVGAGTADYFSGYITDMESFSFSTLGINDYLLETDPINLYPNPASDFIHIESSIPIRKIALYDLSGKLILKQTSTVTNINIEALSSGVYLLEIYGNNNRQYLMKVVKK